MLNFDLSYICWRAYHSVGFLKSSGSDPSGVIYGTLSQIFHLCSIFSDRQIRVFSCDSGSSLRKGLFPQYKSNRLKERTAEEQKEVDEIYMQIADLKTRVLPAIGFSNVCEAEGYEGDDIIAKTVLEHNGKTPIVVSADNDLFQLLDHCSMYDPNKKRLYTSKHFIMEWGVRPKQWMRVKSIAGCKGDGVPSVAEGIGNKTAVKYLNGTLKKSGKLYKKIIEGKAQIKINAPLVVVPFDNNIPNIKLVPDNFDLQGFREVCEEFEFANSRFTKAFEKLL